MSNILDNFALPIEASEAIAKMSLRQTTLDDGVSRFSGHDKGLPFRFWIHTEYNAVQSKLLKYEKFDEIEMIEWHTDLFSKPTERVKELPPQLIHIDEFTGEASGRYAEAYNNFKKGLKAPGTSLSKWGVIPDHEIATLTHNGIYTIEQLAATPRAKIQGKFPKAFTEYLDRAVQFVNGKQTRDTHSKELLELDARNQELQKKLNDMQLQIEALAVVKATKKAGKKEKKSEEESEVSGNLLE